MSTNLSNAGQTISETAKQEGGTTKGSVSAQMQSQITKERNAAQAEAAVGSKLATDPDAITKEDAQFVQSREHRAAAAEGLGGPGASSLASDTQHVAAENEGAARPRTGPLDPAEQSQLSREQNYADAAATVGGKLASEPGNVSKEEADLLHSRETRAFGTTEKGGLASQAQRQAAENLGAKK